MRVNIDRIGQTKVWFKGHTGTEMWSTPNRLIKKAKPHMSSNTEQGRGGTAGENRQTKDRGTSGGNQTNASVENARNAAGRSDRTSVGRKSANNENQKKNQPRITFKGSA